MQYQLHKCDYDFLRYGSFLCATALVKLPVSRLTETIASGQTSYVGQLTASDLDAVLEACRNSDLFKPSEKRNFFY